MTERVNELAAVSLRKPVKIFVDSNKTVAWTLQQEFIRIRPSQEALQVNIKRLVKGKFLNKSVYVNCYKPHPPFDKKIFCSWQEVFLDNSW